MESEDRFAEKSKRETVNSDKTHWRQLCPSILDIEAEPSVSRVSCTLLNLLPTYVPSPKSCHGGSVEEEESE